MVIPTRGVFQSFIKQPVKVVTSIGEFSGSLKGVVGIWLLIDDGYNVFLIKDWIYLKRRKR